jgi:hypothetical protein
MTHFQDERPHPLGLIDNPEWQVTLTRRAELYLEDRARREDPEREPSRMHIALGILAVVGIALSLAAAWL